LESLWRRESKSFGDTLRKLWRKMLPSFLLLLQLLLCVLLFLLK
jgi:hypothetical protein